MTNLGQGSGVHQEVMVSGGCQGFRGFLGGQEPRGGQEVVGPGDLVQEVARRRGIRRLQRGQVVRAQGPR